MFKRVQLPIICLKNYYCVSSAASYVWIVMYPLKKGGTADLFENFDRIIRAGYNLLCDAIENTFLGVGT
jgi:hypothetical protein